MIHRPGVYQLFSQQYGVASTAQLAELGVSAHAVSRARRSGLVAPMMRAVVALPDHADRFESRAMAVHLAAGQRGFLSGMTAGRLHGLRRMPTCPIEYCVRESRPLVAPPWLQLEHTSWDDVEPRIERPDGLCVASPLRMLFGLAAQLDQRRFEQAAEDAWHLQLIDPVSAALYLARVRRSGRTGVTRFEEWLTEVETRTRPATTGLEQLLADLARQAGLPDPHRQYPLTLPSGVTVHLDLAWPDIRLALEPGHSWWHGGNVRMRADQDRDRSCAELGWLVVRFDESVWRRRAATVAQLRRIHQERTRNSLQSS